MRRVDPQTKFRIVKAYLQGTSATELGKAHRVSRRRIYHWLDLFNARGPEIFEHGQVRRAQKRDEALAALQREAHGVLKEQNRKLRAGIQNRTARDNYGDNYGETGD